MQELQKKRKKYPAGVTSAPLVRLYKQQGMSDRTDDIILVKKAQLGDRDSLNCLAETARVRLHQYVLRLTLNEDLAQDIVQETMLEMLRIFKTLRKTEMFWPWLYGIAINKTRNHYGKLWRRKKHDIAERGPESKGVSGNDTLSKVVTAELKQIVMRSVSQLSPRHRAVLTMRCYDHLSYAQIAKLMNCSEIGARAAFYRAKKCLARRLSAYGLGKGALLLALVAFGKITATTKAGAAQIAVTQATLQVGPIAALVGAVTGRTGLVTLAAAGTLTAGSVALHTEPIAAIFNKPSRPASALASASLPFSRDHRGEHWYYYPEGDGGPVMQRLLQSGATERPPVCRVLQNQYANYHLDLQSNAVHIHSHRAWKADLSVMRLPTDSAELSRFIARMEGRPADMELTAVNRNRLLVICHHETEHGSTIWRIDRQMNLLEEEYFQVSWPESVPVVDERDTMHERGWTYFEINGHINGRSVSGAGRLPFVYAEAREHYPWLRIRIAGGSTLVDTPTGARIYDRKGLIDAEFHGRQLLPGTLASLDGPAFNRHGPPGCSRRALAFRNDLRPRDRPRSGHGACRGCNAGLHRGYGNRCYRTRRRTESDQR